MLYKDWRNHIIQTLKGKLKSVIPQIFASFIATHTKAPRGMQNDYYLTLPFHLRFSSFWTQIVALYLKMPKKETVMIYASINAIDRSFDFTKI